MEVLAVTQVPLFDVIGAIRIGWKYIAIALLTLWSDPFPSSPQWCRPIWMFYCQETADVMRTRSPVSRTRLTLWTLWLQETPLPLQPTFDDVKWEGGKCAWELIALKSEPELPNVLCKGIADEWNQRGCKTSSDQHQWGRITYGVTTMHAKVTYLTLKKLSMRSSAERLEVDVWLLWDHRWLRSTFPSWHLPLYNYCWQHILFFSPRVTISQLSQCWLFGFRLQFRCIRKTDSKNCFRDISVFVRTI